MKLQPDSLSRKRDHQTPTTDHERCHEWDRVFSLQEGDDWRNKRQDARVLDQ